MEKPSILLLSIVRLKQLQKPEEVRFTYQPEEYACYSIRLKSNIHLYLEQGACILAAFPEKEEGYDSAEPNEHNKYQDFGPATGRIP